MSFPEKEKAKTRPTQVRFCISKISEVSQGRRLWTPVAVKSERATTSRTTVYMLSSVMSARPTNTVFMLMSTPVHCYGCARLALDSPVPLNSDCYYYIIIITTSV